MDYLTYLNIKYFKGIESFELKELSGLNIIVGNNNTGKTSLLEAISLLQSQDSVKTILKHISRKESIYPSKFQLFLELFPKQQEELKSIQINSTINNLNRELILEGKVLNRLSIEKNSENSFDQKLFKGNISIKLNNQKIMDRKIELKENQMLKEEISYDIIKIIYITAYDHSKEGLINKTIENIKEKEKNKIIKLLQLFDSNILDFKVTSTNNEENLTTTYIKHKTNGMMPLFSFGDSIKKILTLASAVINAKNGILLVDEIETAIHKNMIDKVFKWFVNFCEEYEVQLICTTHSLEIIDGMISSVEDKIDSLSCFRIESYEEKLYSTKFSGTKLKDIRTFLGQDVR